MLFPAQGDHPRVASLGYTKDELEAARERFDSGVDKSSGCWAWMRGTDVSGYGVFRIERRGPWRKARRLAFYYDTGIDPGDQFVLHSCDNPPCVNPAHLSLGDQRENMRQASERGRVARPSARLSVDDVRAIRGYVERGGIGAAAQMARVYGVGQPTISDIINRKTWKHVA